MKNLNLKTYSDVSRWSLSGIMLIVCFAIAAVVVMVVSGILQFVPFNENTAVALFAAFGGGICLCALLLVLNIASNVSLMAAINLQTTGETLVKNQPQSSFKKWFMFTVFISTFGLFLTIGGTIYSKQKFTQLFLTQSKEISDTNVGLLQKIALQIPNTSNGELKVRQNARRDISSALKIIEAQKNNVPTAKIIWPKKILDKTVFDYATSYSYYSTTEKDEADDLYKCTSEKLCSWIADFFDGKKVDPYFESSFMKDTYEYYSPIEINGQKFILLLDKRQNYGKVGS